MKTSTRSALLTACIPAFLLLSAQTAPAQDMEIHILCSNSFHEAMQKLLPEAERTAGRRINVQFGASANFKRLIEGGEPFDLAIVTPQIIADLIKEGKIAPGTATDLASTGIGIAVRAGQPKPDVSTTEAIKRTVLQAKSIGYVQVGAGTPAVITLLEGLGISAD